MSRELLSQQLLPVILSTLDIKAHNTLNYKLHVLLYDLRDIAKHQQAEQRILRSTDELYLGLPYFTPNESALIKTITVSDSIGLYEQEISGENAQSTDINEGTISSTACKSHITVEEMIHFKL
jgi:hypothetical protein